MDNLKIDRSKIFIPDGQSIKVALKRTTDLVFAAHQDDVEIMCGGPIIECLQDSNRYLGAIILTDGRGSPRTGKYQHYSDEEMIKVRSKEQKKAAIIGEYSFLIELGYSSADIKSSNTTEIVDNIKNILQVVCPHKIYTHNLADKHETHVAVCLRVIEALRQIAPLSFTYQILGCEVWRGLDWMCDIDKVILDTSRAQNLQHALLGIFDSQISGGKRYDLATMGRRLMNATYLDTHRADTYNSINYAMDLTPLCLDPSLSIEDYLYGYIQRFWRELQSCITKLHPSPHLPRS